MIFEQAERIAAKPAFLIAFNAALIAMFVVVGLDAANIFISIITAELVLLGLGGARRSQLATHAKLDELIAANDKARDELKRVEDADEDAIEDKRT